MLSAALGGARSTPVDTGRAAAVLRGYAEEDSTDVKVLAEYIWLGQSGVDMRSRTIVLDCKPSCVEDLPVAEIDGSSYGHAPAESCEVYLQPRKVFPDPFRGGDHILVLCDTFVPPLMDVPEALHHLKPHPTNRRPACDAVMEQASSSAPMFSVVQGYSLSEGEPEPAPHYSSSSCSSAPVPVPMGVPGRCYAGGGMQRLGREVSELHMRACLKAGLHYTSSYSEAPAMYSYKIGPCGGVELADQLSASRYMLQRAAEHRDVAVVYPSKGIVPGDWGGNCCQVEFSTKDMRCPSSGMVAIHQQLSKLQGAHAQHVLGYGGGGLQQMLMTKGGEVSFQRAMQFSVGVGNKRAAVMIPTSTVLSKQGPVVDRRAPADCDPYLVVMLLACTACNIPCPVNLVQQPAFALAGTAQGGAYGSPHASACGLPSSHRPTNSCASFSRATDSLDSLSGLSAATADSEELLISALDKIDRFAPTTPPMPMAGISSSVSDACSEVCSDASSPLQGASCLQASLSCPLAAADQDMFYE